VVEKSLRTTGLVQEGIRGSCLLQTIIAPFFIASHPVTCNTT